MRRCRGIGVSCLQKILLGCCPDEDAITTKALNGCIRVCMHACDAGFALGHTVGFILCGLEWLFRLRHIHTVATVMLECAVLKRLRSA